LKAGKTLSLADDEGRKGMSALVGFVAQKR
jgi:hypothetical protein